MHTSHANPAAQLGRLLRRAEVEALVGLGRSSIYAMMAEGRFPRPVRVGRGAVRWPEAVIQAWVAARLAQDGRTAIELLAEINGSHGGARCPRAGRMASRP